MNPPTGPQPSGDQPWKIVVMSEADAQAIVRWRYPAPYDFYDMASDPEDLAEILDPKGWGDAYFAVHRGGSLDGFFEFIQEGDSLVVGLGMHPDQTGKGLGTEFVLAGLQFARERWQPKRFRLFVAAFNARAIRVYGRVGFRQTRTLFRSFQSRQVEFLEMVMG
jgi:[ribosomal protein S18]-alanine N-acetyltransferase